MHVAPPDPPGELRPLVRLAWPLILQQIGLQLMGMVDLALVGRFDPGALAAVGVANSLVFAISCVGMGIMMGLDAIVPSALGAGRPQVARRAFHDGVRLAIWVGAGLAALVALSPTLLPVLDIDDGVITDATVYVTARAFGVMPFLLQVAMRSYLSAHGRTRPLVAAVIVGNLVNLVLDYLLIFGDAGLADLGLPAVGMPAMGVLGAAAATSGVQLATLLLYGAAIRRLHDGGPPPSAEPSAVRTILRHGVPTGLQTLAEVGVFALSGLLAAMISVEAAGAHNVAITLASFAFSLAMGVGGAAAVRVGRAFGAGDRARGRRAGLASLGLGTAIMSCTAAIFVITPGPLIALFTDDAGVARAAEPLIQIAAFFQLSDGVQAVATGALRGAGDTRAALVANLIGHYGLGLGVSLVLAFAASMGAPGLWWGLSAGLTLTAAVLVYRFLRITRPRQEPAAAPGPVV